MGREESSVCRVMKRCDDEAHGGASGARYCERAWACGWPLRLNLQQLQHMLFAPDPGRRAATYINRDAGRLRRFATGERDSRRRGRAAAVPARPAKWTDMKTEGGGDGKFTRKRCVSLDKTQRSYPFRGTQHPPGNASGGTRAARSRVRESDFNISCNSCTSGCRWLGYPSSEAGFLECEHGSTQGSFRKPRGA